MTPTPSSASRQTPRTDTRTDTRPGIRTGTRAGTRAGSGDTLRASLRRTALLGRVNWRLMVRNRTTMLYAFLLPVMPLGLLVAAAVQSDDGLQIDPSAGVLGIALILALVFPGYYNVLSMFVTRRDELVLKRLRTGEIRDRELLVSMALPGAVITVAVTVLAVVLGAVLGLPLPGDPVLLGLTVVLSLTAFAAFAYWTAGWTSTAESAQLTSGPVIVLAMAGFAGPLLPDSWQRWVELTPGSAIDLLLRAGWFGQDGVGGETGLGLVDTWTAAAPSIGVLVVWTVLAVVLARRSMRWEPRA